MFERSKGCQVVELRAQISGKFHSPCEMITQEECIVVVHFSIVQNFHENILLLIWDSSFAKWFSFIGNFDILSKYYHCLFIQ
jgi:hypothetical protein